MSRLQLTYWLLCRPRSFMTRDPKNTSCRYGLQAMQIVESNHIADKAQILLLHRARVSRQERIRPVVDKRKSAQPPPGLSMSLTSLLPKVEPPRQRASQSRSFHAPLRLSLSRLPQTTLLLCHRGISFTTQETKSTPCLSGQQATQQIAQSNRTSFKRLPAQNYQTRSAIDLIQED